MSHLGSITLFVLSLAGGVKMWLDYRRWKRLSAEQAWMEEFR